MLENTNNMILFFQDFRETEHPTTHRRAKRLFAVSRLEKKSSNDTDRLAKYLTKFGLRFRNLRV